MVWLTKQSRHFPLCWKELRLRPPDLHSLSTCLLQTRPSSKLCRTANIALVPANQRLQFLRDAAVTSLDGLSAKQLAERCAALSWARDSAQNSIDPDTWPTLLSPALSAYLRGLYVLPPHKGNQPAPSPFAAWPTSSPSTPPRMGRQILKRIPRTASTPAAPTAMATDNHCPNHNHPSRPRLSPARPTAVNPLHLPTPASASG